MHCNHKYTPAPKHHGYPESLRKRAVEMYINGGNLRRIARHLKVTHQTVSLWVRDVAKTLPNAPVSDEVKEVKMDEIYTFMGNNKTELYSDYYRLQNQMYLGLGSGLDTYP